MNDQVISPLGVNFTISNRLGPIAVWQSGTGEHDCHAVGNRRDLVESVPGEGPTASGPNQKDYRIRCKAIIGNGARGTLAGLIEAVKCALGKSTDGLFSEYVLQRRKEIQDHCEVVLQKTLYKKEKIT